MATHNIVALSIESLLNGNDRYIIPVYQRNYAWQEREITQLIQDVIDYIPKTNDVQDYYIGTLVTYERKIDNEIVYETIDGQQRITTLTLLTSAIRHFYAEISPIWFKKVNLKFESRKSSSETLQQIFLYGDSFPSNQDWNDKIIDGFHLCREILRKKLAEHKMPASDFASFLFGRVKILRVTVPADTDLNHYFEIMNNRGEQLEKHAILKSMFLEILNGLDNPDKQVALSTFDKIWEACSNMEKYVQYGFPVEERHAIFGIDDWNTLQPVDFHDLTQKIRYSVLKGHSEQLLITEIIEGKNRRRTEPTSEDQPDRFNSVINFPNFLLHILRIYLQKDIPLDDKRLILTFQKEIEISQDKIKFAQEFAYELLRGKFYFDKYIIKREFLAGEDRWSLKRLKWSANNKVSYVNTFGQTGDESDYENRAVLMLLSMFHVSTPTPVYKHWLNAALFYLMRKSDFCNASSYKNYLIAIARSFVFDRYLSKFEPKDYYDIIYHSSEMIRRSPETIDIKKLSYGEIENNLVFNYLDYLLWEQNRGKKEVSQFEFSFRSSVEHYYPRNPMLNYPALDQRALDSFGNLCLISHSKNSRLSNQPPIAKQSHYHKQKLDSIKQWIMMTKYDAYYWNEKSIFEHQQGMLDVLFEEMSSDFSESAQLYTQSFRESTAHLWFNQYKNDHERRPLLGRAIMSFDAIEVQAGNLRYLDKIHPRYFLYDWDQIKSGNCFEKFRQYIDENNPSGLSSIIQKNLEENKDLKNDPFRFTFVKYPEIWKYCEQGYFSWINDGKTILLHYRERNTENSTINLLILLLKNWFEKTFAVKVSEWREGFDVIISYNYRDNQFEFDSDEGKGKHLLNGTKIEKSNVGFSQTEMPAIQHSLKNCLILDGRLTRIFTRKVLLQH